MASKPWAAANLGVPVVIHEMRPKVATFAHRTGDFAEMVCSNSFRSDDHEQNAVGLIHWEMRAAGSLVMEMALKHRLPAGGALAVDRGPFAASVTGEAEISPADFHVLWEVTELPSSGHWIIATGPLTSPALASIRAATGAEALAFFDAIAPIVYTESIDMSVAWLQSRYDKGETEDEQKAYINCPMTRKDQYEAFIDALLAAEKTEFHEGETAAGYFDGCLPIEVMAERGRETLRHGPMKPVGLTNAHKPDEKGLCRGPVGPRQQAWHAAQYRRVQGQDEVRRASRCLQDDSGWRTPVSPGLAASIATRSSTRPRCWTRRCG